MEKKQNKEMNEKATCEVCFGKNVHHKDGCLDCGPIMKKAKEHINIGDTIVYTRKDLPGIDFATPGPKGFKASLFYNKAGAIALRDWLNEIYPIITTDADTA